LSETLAGRAFLENRTIVVDDLDEYEGEYSASSDNYKSCIAVPIKGRGIFQVISDKIGAFNKFDKEMAELLALQFDTALKRKEEENKIKRSKKEYQAFIDTYVDKFESQPEMLQKAVDELKARWKKHKKGNLSFSFSLS